MEERGGEKDHDNMNSTTTNSEVGDTVRSNATHNEQDDDTRRTEQKDGERAQQRERWS